MSLGGFGCSRFFQVGFQGNFNAFQGVSMGYKEFPGGGLGCSQGNLGCFGEGGELGFIAFHGATGRFRDVSEPLQSVSGRFKGLQGSESY